MLDSPLSTRWAVQTMSSALLSVFDTHHAAAKCLEHCQFQVSTDSAWLVDLCIRHIEMKA